MENYRPGANDAHWGALPVGGVGESEEVWGVREQPGCTPTVTELITYKCTMRERERIFLFNDALNTFYLRLYGVRHMFKDHSDSEK